MWTATSSRSPAVSTRNGVAVLGHSRLGKTALWAGAQDERFAIVISNDSGRGRRVAGSAAVRRGAPPFGQHGPLLVPRARYRQYAWHESDLPVDAHMLVALIDPPPGLRGPAPARTCGPTPAASSLAAKNAEPVYRLVRPRRAGRRPDAAAGRSRRRLHRLPRPHGQART